MDDEDKKLKKLLKKIPSAMQTFSEALAETIGMEGNELKFFSDAWMSQKISEIMEGSYILTIIHSRKNAKIKILDILR